MSASIDVSVRVDVRRVDASLRVPAGRTLALVGPNGAGKSTVLQAVAGLLRPDAGEVSIGGRVVEGASRVPPHRRGVAVLSQRPLLFPHLSVAENVAFGPRARGVGRRQAFRIAHRELDAVGCADLARRRPAGLSGGQQQRVAIARALAVEPVAVLLDEPMAALGVDVAPEIRRLLRRRLADQTVLVATHDLMDVLALADEVAVLDAGRVVELGPVAEVLAQPRTDFLARLAGLNLLSGTALGTDRLDVGEGQILTGLAEDPLPPGQPGLATVEPAAVAVHLTQPGGSPRSVLAATVSSLEARGSLVRVACRLPGGQSVRADVTAAAAVELDLHEGRPVRLGIKAAQVRLYPRVRVPR